MEEGKGVLVGKYCSVLGSELHALIINGVVRDGMITRCLVIHQVGIGVVWLSRRPLSGVAGSILLVY